ncbi:hypothetical protein ACFXTN_042141 [Malus domestica]
MRTATTHCHAFLPQNLSHRFQRVPQIKAVNPAVEEHKFVSLRLGGPARDVILTFSPAAVGTVSGGRASPTCNPRLTVGVAYSQSTTDPQKTMLKMAILRNRDRDLMVWR